MSSLVVMPLGSGLIVQPSVVLALGPVGPAATVAVGTTTTLAAGAPATVANSGTSGAAVLNFGVPAGAQGVQGPPGIAQNQLMGRTIAFVGDSITAIGTYPEQVGTLTGATIVKAGFSGCRLSINAGDVNRDAFSGTRIADAIASGVWTAQDAANTALGGIYTTGLAALKATTWSGVDTIVWAYGTNDWAAEATAVGAAGDTVTSTLWGAVQHITSTIATAFPGVQIRFIAPLWRSSIVDGDLVNLADAAVNVRGVTLGTFADNLIAAAESLNVPVLDLRRMSGIDRYNATTYLDAGGLHPTTAGFARLAQTIAPWLISPSLSTPGTQPLTAGDTPAFHDVRLPILTNGVVNGDFSSTFGWAPMDGSSITASGNVLTATYGSATPYPTVTTISLAMPFSVGDKAYIRLRFNTPSTVLTTMYPYLIKTGAQVGVASGAVVPNTWQVASGVATIIAAGAYEFKMAPAFTSAAAAAGQTVAYAQPIAVNLTAMFGAGNEPTVAQMDRLITAIPWWAGAMPVGPVLAAVMRGVVVSADVPASATAPGQPGQVAANATYLYICTAANTWRRVSIAAW